MNTDIDHEIMKMPNWKFPIKILRRETTRESMGCAFHWHEQIEFYMVRHGGVLLLCSDEKEWIYEGDIAVVNCCYPHKSINFMDSTLHYCIQVDLSILSSGEEDICHDFVQGILRNQIAFKRFIKQDLQLSSLLCQIVDEYENRGPGYELAIKACLYSIFTKLYRKYTEENSNSKMAGGHGKELYLVGRLLSDIAENFSAQITLEGLARGIGVSVPHMCRIFKKRTGTTVGKYISQLRCHRARLLLANGYNVTSAAFAVGFTDSNYFSRVFKQVFGIAPSYYHLARNNTSDAPGVCSR